MTPLQQSIARHIDAVSHEDGFFETAINELILTRSTTETLPHPVLYKPALCVVAQGAKRTLLDGDAIAYQDMQALVVTAEMPIRSGITRASKAVPYLGLILEFDLRLLGEVLEEFNDPPKPARRGPALLVHDIQGALADSVLRLVNLLDMPGAIPVLAKSAMREIYFWLLSGPHGASISRLATPDSHTERLSRAIHLLRENLARSISVDELAAAAKMSPSSFHQHFKVLTLLTPLQYQKQLRLLEARRLMLADAVTATTAAYRVGYESPSQFSREYARMFGAPPRRDVAVMRTIA
ncbi:AraC family transcriptional regulator [[Pseudomonas] carboxydohydrogena]|uniref:AraC family transcriptional regulator n=1 Tax=Afipia carboxydohydrogena TaxID=290 RepID=A0ABY8BLF1_AFICR|nr:AraC family transcriptional regulator [[Pseudomonas] carboxydohydrogena]WEF50812.1 AraC family transcriptional regulator [[Pseudomonas] carboxydohydrogena]